MDNSELYRYVGLFWKDELAEEDIDRIALRGKSYLQHIAGCELDFEEEGLAKDLLFDYVRYDRDHASALYPKNYRDQLYLLAMLNPMVEDDGTT